MFRLNLRLFDADNTHVMPINTTTDTTATTGNDLSPEMRTYYTKQLLENCRPDLVFSQFSKKEPIPTHGGKTIQFRRLSKIAPPSAALTEGVTPAGTKLNVVEVTATVAQYGQYVALSDVLQTSAIDPMLEATLKELGATAGEHLDALTRDVVVGGTRALFAGGRSARSALTATDKITMDLIYDAARVLKRNDIPKINGEYICVIHPDVAKDLKRTTDWQEFVKYQRPEKIYEGDIGSIDGIRFIETSHAKHWTATEAGTTNVPVYATVVFGANAYAETEISGLGLDVIVKQLGSGGTEDPLNQRATVGWKATHVAKRLDELSIIRIESAVSSSTDGVVVTAAN